VSPLCSAVALAYMLRVNISVAAVKMKDELNWSEDQKGYILVRFAAKVFFDFNRLLSSAVTHSIIN